MRRIIVIIYLFLFACIITYAESDITTEQAFLLSLSQNKDKKIIGKEEMKKEEELLITGIQAAVIYEANKEDEKALMELEKITEDKKDFNYYYIIGKINKKRGEKDEAIKNLKKAEELNSKNIYVKIELYELYSLTGGLKKEQEAEKKGILDSGISEEEKTEFKKLVKKYERKSEMDIMAECYTGIKVTDNVMESNNDLKSDVGIVNGAMAGAVIKYDRFIKLYLAGSYKNTIYLSNYEESSHDFIIVAEPVKQYRRWSLSVPSVSIISFINGQSDVFISTGIKGKKKLGKKIEFLTGIDLGYKNNSENDYDGMNIDSYSGLKWVSRLGVNYEAQVKLSDEIYNKKEFGNIGIGVDLTASKLILKKYKMNVAYGVNYKKYNDKQDSEERNDIRERFNMEVEIPFWKAGWKYLIGYEHKGDSSTIDTYDYCSNNIYARIKKEF